MTVKRLGQAETESAMLRMLARQARNANINCNFEKIKESMTALVAWNRSMSDDGNGTMTDEEMIDSENRAFKRLREKLAL